MTNMAGLDTHIAYRTGSVYREICYGQNALYDPAHCTREEGRIPPPSFADREAKDEGSIADDVEGQALGISLEHC